MIYEKRYPGPSSFEQRPQARYRMEKTPTFHQGQPEQSLLKKRKMLKLEYSSSEGLLTVENFTTDGLHPLIYEKRYSGPSSFEQRPQARYRMEKTPTFHQGQPEQSLLKKRKMLKLEYS